MESFDELDLIEPVRRALADEGYKIPTPIQARTIPSALAGRDVLGCAQTGTGKTAAYAVPILCRLGQQNRKAVRSCPRAMVLAPTRELAIQIGDSFATYGRQLRLRHTLVYGGVGQERQVRALNRGTHILVATPGRLLDLMNQGHVDLGQLETFVLDEADRMLDMGFLPDLKRIIRHLPDQRQSLFFSATLPPTITSLAKRLLTDPVSVNVTPKSTSVKAIQQQVLFVERKGKEPLLRSILNRDGADRVLVFTRTKRTANNLAERLLRSGTRATAIHGNKSQNARQRALEAFRQKRVQVLVATDVAARGIDIDGITHVVNFDLPVEPESYVHRIGRTGRAGAAGIALSFCSTKERPELRAIEKLIGAKVPPAADQPQSEGQQTVSLNHKSSTPSRRQRGKTAQTPARTAKPNSRTRAPFTGDEPQSEDKPPRARRRHKRRYRPQKVKQGTA